VGGRSPLLRTPPPDPTPPPGFLSRTFGYAGCKRSDSATVPGRPHSTSSCARPVRTSSGFRSIAKTLTRRPHMTRKARSDFRHDDARRSSCGLRSGTSSGRRTPADPSSAGLTFAAGPLGAVGEETFRRVEHHDRSDVDEPVHRQPDRSPRPARLAVGPRESKGMLIGRHRRYTGYGTRGGPPDDPISRHHQVLPRTMVMVRAIGPACAIGRPWSSDTVSPGES
jgi:hypothetical protein